MRKIGTYFIFSAAMVILALWYNQKFVFLEGVIHPLEKLQPLTPSIGTSAVILIFLLLLTIAFRKQIVATTLRIVFSLIMFGASTIHYLLGILLILFYSPFFCNNARYLGKYLIFNGDFLSVPVVFLIVLYSWGIKANLEEQELKPERNDENEKFRRGPITSKGQDQFEFGEMSDQIYNDLIKNTPKSLGIIGGYGSGKTSMFNLVKEKILIESEMKVPSLRTQSLVNNVVIIELNLHRFENLQNLHEIMFDKIIHELEKFCWIPSINHENIAGELAKKALSGISAGIFSNKFSTALQYENYLRKLESILKLLGVYTIILLDDIDRVPEQDNPMGILKVLNLFSETENITLVLPISYGYLKSILGDVEEDSIKKEERASMSTFQESDSILKYLEQIHFIPGKEKLLFEKIIMDIILGQKIKPNFYEQLYEKPYASVNSSNSVKLRLQFKDSDFKDVRDEVFSFVVDELKSRRQIVSFSKVLGHNLEKFDNFICLRDIIVFSVIEVTASDLFDFFKTNGENLTVNALTQLSVLEGKYKFNIDQYESFFKRNSRFQILHEIFPFLKEIVRSNLKEGEKARAYIELQEKAKEFEQKSFFENRIGNDNILKLFLNISNKLQFEHSAYSIAFREALLKSFFGIEQNQGNRMQFFEEYCFNNLYVYSSSNLQWLLLDALIKLKNQYRFPLIKAVFSFTKGNYKLGRIRFEAAGMLGKSLTFATLNVISKLNEAEILELYLQLVKDKEISDLAVDAVIGTILDEEKYVSTLKYTKVLTAYIVRVQEKVNKWLEFKNPVDMDNLITTFLDKQQKWVGGDGLSADTIYTWFYVYEHGVTKQLAGFEEWINPAHLLKSKIEKDSLLFEQVFTGFSYNALGFFQNEKPEMIFGKGELAKLVQNYLKTDSNTPFREVITKPLQQWLDSNPLENDKAAPNAE